MAKIVLGRQQRSPQPDPQSAQLLDVVQGAERRLKMVEERYTNLRGRIQITEQNMLTKHKTFYAEIKALSMEMSEVKKEMHEIKDRILALLKELEGFAKRENLDVLRRYIDLWQPVNFVTKNEVEEIVADAIESREKLK